ncbi:FecR family protein [Paenibacillus planticolens]|nr:FecR domain-containing protein [Paenibacillus planticolens]
MGMSKKSFVSLCLSLSLVLSLISGLLAKPADAKTVRVAVVSSLSGEVTVKKGGGSKSYDAYENMSLNQGDTVYTGANSSATLNLSNGDADVTLGENAEINVSDLNSADGKKKSKLKVWAGSMWVKVKSLAGSDDEFEVETPTAVMGVRGTQFFVMVDPATGSIKMAVGAGKVSASTVTIGEDLEQKTSITYLYPTQQISLDSRDETQDLSLKVDFLDLDDFVSQASPEVIRAFILNKAEIDKENDEFIAKKAKELVEGKVTDDSNLVIKSKEDLDKVKQNFDNLIGNVAKKALADNKIDRSAMDKLINETNKKISEQGRKLDLSTVKDLDKTAGIDAEKEKAKQVQLKKLEAEKLKNKLEREKKEAEVKKQLEAQIKLIEEKKKQQDLGSGGSGSDSSTPPTPPTLNVESPVIEESPANDGSIAATQVITLANGTFDSDMSTGVTVNHLPAGLTASVTRNSSTKITIAFNGNALAHTSADDVTNVFVTIAKEKITGAKADVNSGEFKIKFRNPEVPTPRLSLSHGEVNASGNFLLNVNLSDFIGDNSVYGVELHLTYGPNINFKANSWVSNSAIFDAAASADYMKQFPNETQNELVYAVTNFGSATNIEVNGEKNLVVIPMNGRSLQTGTAPYTIKVEKVVIIHKNGSDVQKVEVTGNSEIIVNLPDLRV